MGSDDGYLIAREYVFATQVPSSREYKLISDAGEMVNFGGFNQFRLFARYTNDRKTTLDAVQCHWQASESLHGAHCKCGHWCKKSQWQLHRS